MIQYVSQPKKTIDEKGNRYLTGVNCVADVAMQSFMATKHLYGKDTGTFFYQYAFALFYCFIHFDTNTHQEPSEMFVVYGVDSVEDIRIAEIDGQEVANPAEIEDLFENIHNAAALGNDDFQETVLDTMTEVEQLELMNSGVEIKFITNDGLVITNMSYFPTINYLSWGSSYYKLSEPVSLK